MKWKINDFKSACARRCAGVQAVLIYGPDAGQVDELTDQMAESIGIEQMNVSVVDAHDLKDRADQIFAEAFTPSLLGGRRLIIIRGASDSHATIISELCSHSSLDAFIIVASDNLKPKTSGGKLRPLFEDGTTFGAMACYFDDGGTLITVITEMLRELGITKIDSDAMTYMCQHLGEDRGMTRSYINKLSLYVNDTKHITLDSVEKCLGDSGVASMDEFVFGVASGHMMQMLNAMDRLLADGAVPVQMSRALTNHMKRLLTVVTSDAVAPMAVKQLRPAVFFKYENQMVNQARFWPASEIISMLDKLVQVEKKCKTTGMPGEIVIADFSLKMAIYAAKLNAKKRRG